MKAQHLAAIALVAIAVCGPAGAQPNTSSWSATLQDARGVPLGSVAITVASGANQITVRTSDDGRFTVAALTPGTYSVSVQCNRSGAASTRNIEITTTSPPAILQCTATGELAIPDAAPSREGTGGEQLSSKAVSQLPLNKRDFSQLLLLAAGTMTDTSGASNYTQQFAVNGQRGTAAVFVTDGADSTDPEMGGATFTTFNVDAVQEIQSNSGWMPAEIGRGAAGFTNVITRSGTNSVHGSAFEFLRNAALDARNFFDRRSTAEPARIPPFVRNEFGLTNGGPVSIPHLYNGRNRTFYFVEYQGFRQVLGTTHTTNYCPELTSQAGNIWGALLCEMGLSTF